jgi:addiction module HigA family antidote
MKCRSVEFGPAIQPGEILLNDYPSLSDWGRSRPRNGCASRSNRLNEIVLGKRGITADTVLRSRLLKTPPRLWMRLQADWDLHQALQRERRKAS